MYQERRLHPRAVVRLPAQLGGAADVWEEALLYDLSGSGAGIHTRSRLPLQSEVRLRFRFPAGSGEEIEVTALAVRKGPSEQVASPYSHASGLHFLDLHGKRYDRVRAEIWRLVNQEND